MGMRYEKQNHITSQAQTRGHDYAEPPLTRYYCLHEAAFSFKEL